jgi:hypothetical protein
MVFVLPQPEWFLQGDIASSSNLQMANLHTKNPNLNLPILKNNM